MNAEKKLGPLDADPNLVPFRDEWKDNTGGMANAIFWLEKNWNKQLNAQGDFVDEHGRRWFWNYGWITKILLVHINGSREHWIIDRKKMLHCKDGNEDNATIYRPFFQAQAYGMSLYDGQQPVVEWLKTREVVVQKNHHPYRIPLYLGEAHANLKQRLLNAPLGQFPHVVLTSLLVDIKETEGKEFLTARQAEAYSDLIKHLQLLGSVKDAYEPHHMHSYTALVDLLRVFNSLINDDLNYDEFFKTNLFYEMNRLVKLYHDRDAAMADALSFKRTFEESLKKTTQMADANRQFSEGK